MFVERAIAKWNANAMKCQFMQHAVAKSGTFLILGFGDDETETRVGQARRTTCFYRVSSTSGEVSHA